MNGFRTCRTPDVHRRRHCRVRARPRSADTTSGPPASPRARGRGTRGGRPVDMCHTELSRRLADTPVRDEILELSRLKLNICTLYSCHDYFSSIISIIIRRYILFKIRNTVK